MGIHDVVFLLSFSILSIVALVFLIYLFMPVLLPFILIFGLVGYFKFKLSIPIMLAFTVLLIIILLVLLYIIMKLKPLWIDSLLNEVKNFITILSTVASLIMFTLVVILIGGTTIFGTQTHDFSKHLWRSHYAWVIDIYQNMYSGYPKILIDNSQEKNNTYYVPFEAGEYYYVYNIQDVKKRYFADLNKTQIQQTLCKKKSLRDEFMNTYIIDNPYIKAQYQNKRFSINDKNTTLKEFNETKIISINDINSSLCNGMVK